MDFQTIKLEKNNVLPEEEKQGWEEGVFVGKEKGNFHIDLPRNYAYNQDFRLQGTNSFVIKNQDFAFTIIGEEVQKSLHLHENENQNFENSIKEYLDKVFSYLKSNGIENPKNLKLYKIETENISWYRANYSYEINNKIFSGTYNLLGKVLIKIFAGKTLKEAGYGKNKTYQEHKIIDFLSLKINSNQKFFALIYTFDEVSTKDTEEMVKTINEISKSLGYYDKNQIELKFMKKEQHEELKKSFENISKLLEDQNLSIEERKKFETLKSQLAGALMSSWLPVGGGRKFIMFIIALIAVYFLAQSAYIAMIIMFVILCMFSPRIIGEVAVLVGTAKGNK